MPHVCHLHANPFSTDPEGGTDLIGEWRSGTGNQLLDQRTEDSHHFVNFGASYIQGRHEAQTGGTRRIDEQPACERFIHDARTDFAAKFQCQQQAHAANFPKVFELRCEVLSGLSNVRQESRSRDLLNDGVADRRHEGISIERAALIAGFEETNIFARDECGEGNSRANAFSEREDVRAYLRMFEAEHFAGAANSGLDLIEDEQHLELGAELSQITEEFEREGNDTGFALDRLQHDRGGLRIDHAPDSIEIIHTHTGETGDLRFVEIFELRLA